MCNSARLGMQKYQRLYCHLCNKRVRPTKNEPQQQVIWKERGRVCVRERGVGGRAGQKAVIFKVRLSLGEIEI